MLLSPTRNGLRFFHFARRDLRVAKGAVGRWEAAGWRLCRAGAGATVRDMTAGFPGALQQTPLRNGGILTWREFGNPDGRPLVFLHGWPSEAFQAGVLHEEANRLGWRVIAPNRPGIGGSTRIPGRTFSAWPPLVRELADALGIAGFPVVGLSGGGPYALACGHSLRDHVRSVAVVSGAPPAALPAQRARFHPVYRSMLAVNDRWPALMRGLLVPAAAAAGLPVPMAALKPALHFLPPRDREVLSDPEKARWYYPGFRNAMKSGAAGIHDDGDPYGRPWPFDVAEIRVPVRVWHGTEDRNFHWELARDLASRIPGARFDACGGEGHFSLLTARATEILSAVGT